MRRRSALVIVPVSGSTAPASKRKRVVFPLPFGSEETKSLAGAELHVQIGDDWPAGERLAELPGDKQLFGSAPARHKIDPDGALRRASFCPIELSDQLAGGLNTTFRFCRAGFGAASEPFQFTTYPIGQRSLIAGLSLQCRITLLEEIAIASRRLEQPVGIAVIQFQHARGDRLQKSAIMTHDQKCFGLRLEQGFEPENAVDIEVIRRFVHQQHIRFEHDGTDDREPFTPSSREGRDRLIGLWKAADAERPGNHPGLFVRIAVVFRQDLQQNIFDRSVMGKQRFLRNIPDAKLPAYRSRATVRRFETGQNLEEGGLSGPVGSDETDMIPFEQGQG